jgi:UDP-2-acetamido-3-amino-2,3-dideoxy-glucuronate N-acetyltransferase
MTSINDVRVIDIKSHVDPRGSLFPLEFSEIPIEPARIFYVTDVPDRKTRGKHSHYKTNQLLICLKGECCVRCKDGINAGDWTLSNPSVALLIPNLIWDEQIYMSPETVLLVISDTPYDKSDYIEDWSQYCEIMKKKREENVLQGMVK